MGGVLPKEQPNLPHINNFATNVKDLRDANVFVSIPKDEVRWNYSCRLINLAAMFLIGHEIAHIACGHVDYLLSTIGNSFLAELGWNAIGSMKPLERQAIECQADQYSFNALLAGAFARNSSKPEASTDDELASLRKLAFDYSFSANTLFRLFGDIRFIGKDLTADWYPPIALRRRIIFGGGCHIARKDLPARSQAIVINALAEGIYATEHAFAMVVGEQPAVAGLKEAFSGKGREHYKLLAVLGEHELAAKLRPFAYTSDELIDS
jgi:hypothetical protein